MSKARVHEKNGTAAVKQTESVWVRAFTSNSEWPDKEEFLDVIYWGRQALGIVIGLLWGLIPLRGFIGLFLFVLINAGLIYIYFTNFQNIDEEEYGGAWEITKEGFMTSFAGFLNLMYTNLRKIGTVKNKKSGQKLQESIEELGLLEPQRKKVN